MLIAIILAIVLIVLQQLGMGGKRKKRDASTVQGLFKHLLKFRLKLDRYWNFELT